jgi:hypothetical protein
MADDYDSEPEDDDLLELEDEEEDAPFDWDDEDPNLVVTFEEHERGREALKTIADDVIRKFDTAWDGSDEYRHKVAEDLRIFSGDLKKKTFPFADCANPHIPICFENVTRVHARMMGELLGDGDSFFSALPINQDDEEIAELRSKHDNWQLKHVVTDFTRQLHRAGLLFLMHGDVVMHSYYDFARRRNCHDTLTPDEFCIPAVYTSTESDLSDVPYMCWVLKLYRHELQAMAAEAGWENVDDILDRQPAWSDDPDQPMREDKEDLEGIDTPDEITAPYKLIWFEGWCQDLPDEPVDRYIQCIVDTETKHILSLTVHEELDWQDKARYEREYNEREAWLKVSSQIKVANNERREEMEGFQEGVESPLIGGPLEEHARTQLAALQAAGDLIAPPPPRWMGEVAEDEDPPEPDPPRKVPIRMFTHAVCVEPLVGNLGTGYGAMLSDFNRAANTALSQFTDAATLANAKQFIKPASLKFKRPFKSQPGGIHDVTGVSAAEMQNSIKEIDFKPANTQLIDIVRMMMEAGQTTMQAPDVLSGQPGKSGETYRGIATRVEQATKQLSVTTRKFADEVVTRAIKNNARLNSVYLPEEQAIEIYDANKAAMERLNIRREMWEQDYRVELRSDMRFASQAQKTQEADELVQMGQHPYLQANQAYQHRAARKALEARGHHDMAATLGPEPPMAGAAPPPGPPGPPGAPPPNMPGLPPGGPPQGPPTPPPGAEPPPPEPG